MTRPQHPNATLVRELFAAFDNADLDKIVTLIPDDAVWSFPGRRGRLAGEHRGRDAILGFLLNVRELTSATFHLELHDVIANDDHAVALFTGHAQRNGKTLRNPTCLRMRIRDRQVVEVWEFVWDLYDVDEFWT